MKKILRYSAIDIVNILSFLFLACCPFSILNKNPKALNVIIIYVLLISVTIFLSIFNYKRENKILRFLYMWLPMFYLPFVFNSLGQIIPYINPQILDSKLISIDRAIFGTDVTIWMQRITTPVLTEILQWIYMSYFFLPMVLMFILYKNKEFTNFKKLVLTLLLGFYSSYIGYFFIPAMGPRFTIKHTIPLEGIFIGDILYNFLDKIEKIKFDVFPSAHTSIALIVLYCSYIYKRKIFLFFLPVVIGIIFSTVYLRYHYVIDVIAGFIVAFIVISFSNFLYRKFVIIHHRDAEEQRKY